MIVKLLQVIRRHVYCHDHSHNHHHHHTSSICSESKIFKVEDPTRSQCNDASHDHSHNMYHNYPTATTNDVKSDSASGSVVTDSVSTHDHDHHHSHEHGHNHTHDNRHTIESNAIIKEGEISPGQVIEEALIRLLIHKNITSAQEISATIEKLEMAEVSMLGAELVAHAWKDVSFRKLLLQDAAAAGQQVGISTSNLNAPTVLRVVENTPFVHHVIVCTLCSCYPTGLLGFSPTWYKSRSYRARVAKEPRKVLVEFGTIIPDDVQIKVHDSTADCRYLVLPLPPTCLSVGDYENSRTCLVEGNNNNRLEVTDEISTSTRNVNGSTLSISQMFISELKKYVTRDRII